LQDYITAIRVLKDAITKHSHLHPGVSKVLFQLWIHSSLMQFVLLLGVQSQ
jgi:hypothetical protein